MQNHVLVCWCIVKNYSKCLKCLKPAILARHFQNHTGLGFFIVHQDSLCYWTTILTKDHYTQNETFSQYLLTLLGQDMQSNCHLLFFSFLFFNQESLNKYFHQLFFKLVWAYTISLNELTCLSWVLTNMEEKKYVWCNVASLKRAVI